MSDAFEHELTAHAKALRQLARALVGDGDADDLLQDVALQALQRPPTVATGLRGWLVAVLRHRAHKHHRSEGRRRAHEAAVPPPREPLPADWLAAQREVVRRLDAELLALPEPYQGTLMLRYFADRTPSEIAEASGVPVATVKSRLQRGLALLRERLDARGADWRALFAAACGLRATATMTSVAWLLGSVAAALLATGLWLSAAPAAPELASPAPAMRSALAVATTSSRDAPIAPPAVDAARLEVTPASTALAIVRGRCVDDGGAPIAGRGVELLGRPPADASRDRPDRSYGLWLAQHRTDAWHHRRTETAADGGFEFTVLPSPQRCELQFDGAMPVSLTVGVMPAAGVTDVGTVQLGASCRLQIRVCDRDGAPVATPQLVLARAAVPGSRFALRARPELHCESAGVLTATVFAGDYIVAQPAGIRRGSRITVPRGCATFACEVVLAASHTGEAIRGIVVDAAGVPLPDVDVATRWGNASGSAARTDSTGRFVLPQPTRAAAETALLLHKPGYEPLRTARGYRWGEHDLRLSLRPAAGVALQVVDADGSPVTDFGACAWPDDGPTPAFARQSHELAAAYHDDGLATWNIIAPAHVLVVPARWDLWRSELVQLPATASAAIPRIVRLPRAAERRVRVQSAANTPVVAARVELIGDSGVLQLGSSVAPLSDWNPGDAGLLLLDEGRTDENGEVLLHGPVDRDVAVRVLVQGVPRCLAHHVRLAEATTLQLLLPRSARLVGRVTPPDLVQQLRRLHPDGAAVRTGFQLCHDRHGTSCGFPDRADAVVLGDDGTFTFDAAPAGDWQLLAGRISPDGLIEPGMQRLAAVHLEPGATTAVVLDLDAWRPAKLDALVLRDGAPLAMAAITLLASRPLANADATVRETQELTTDAFGCFHATVLPGSYRVAIDASPGPAIERIARLVASTRALQVPAGAAMHSTFAIEVATLRLRLLDGAGRVVAGVPVALLGADPMLRRQTAPSGADGRIETLVEPGTFTVEVTPAPWRLESRLQALSWLRGSGDGDADARHRVRLGSITARTGEVASGDFVLPEALQR